ncbi:MAG: hypothetical protein LAO31_12310 [Acidobacteriia bacterium]|nr:hypothetical protein [Terriglobia bacterium]
MNQGEVGFDYRPPLFGVYHPVVAYGFVVIFCLNLVLLYLAFFVHSSVRQRARISGNQKGLARFAFCFQKGSAVLIAILALAAVIARAGREGFIASEFVITLCVDLLLVLPCLIGARRWFRTLSIARAESDTMSISKAKGID